jgi:RNA polymerase sigma-70 factor, ECF subfamily
MFMQVPAGHDEQAGPADPEPTSEFFARVYGELRALASAHLAGERREHTLQATALVNEVYIRLKSQELEGGNPAAFFHAAAESMRRILVDHARARKAAKRGGGRRAVEVTNLAALAEQADSEEILAFDEALLRLDTQSPRAAAVVRLRFFSGLSVEQTASVLEISPRTVNREWTFARAWLYQELACE